MDHLARSLGMTNEGRSQAGYIERGSIIAGAIPEAGRIRAAQPGPPIVGLVAMFRRRIGIGGAAPTGAPNRGGGGVLPFRANPPREGIFTPVPPAVSPHPRFISPRS